MPPDLTPRHQPPLLGPRVAGPVRRPHLVGDASPRTSSVLNERDLAAVARLAAGDERGLAELYDRHGGLAYSLATAILRDGPDAEEVVADAFSQVWRTAANFDPARGSVVAWISTIVRTRALDLIRSQRRRARMLDRAEALVEEGTAPGLGTAAELADRGAEQSEAQRLVRQALDALPTPQRVALELGYFGGLSQSEIAVQLGEPLGTVKTRMRAGMEKLRVVLGPLLGGAA
jgi:RNA polymerase sigma-70 factor, ECF subfamily